MSTEIGFAGEVQKALCDCHAGKWFVYVFNIGQHTGAMIPIGSEVFDTEQEAEFNIEATVRKHAKILLDSMGVDINDATKVRIEKQPHTMTDQDKFYRENSP